MLEPHNQGVKEQSIQKITHTEKALFNPLIMITFKHSSQASSPLELSFFSQVPLWKPPSFPVIGHLSNHEGDAEDNVD